MKKKNIREAKQSPQTNASASYGWLVIVLALAGLGICLYLYSFHVNLLMGDIKSGFLCAADKGLGCNSVISSPHSILMGIPLPAWGAIYFSAIFFSGIGGIIFRRDIGAAFFQLAFIFAIFGLVFDFYLAYTLFFRLETICWLCVSTYLINLAILIPLALLLMQYRRRQPGIGFSLKDILPWKADRQREDIYYRNVIKALLLGAILVSFLTGIAGSYLLSRFLTEDDRERLASIKEDLRQEEIKPMDFENRPLAGSRQAKVTIIEFSDFLCPYCARAAEYLKVAEAGNHGKARIVFRHYPLDKTCNRRLYSTVHPGSCLLAEGSACAFEQDKFWDFHDLAFKTEPPISPEVIFDMATDADLDLDAFRRCLASGRGMKMVQEDIEAGLSAGIKATPTLLINGRMHTGALKPWVFNEIIKFAEQNLPMPE